MKAAFVVLAITFSFTEVYSLDGDYGPAAYRSSVDINIPATSG